MEVRARAGRLGASLLAIIALVMTTPPRAAQAGSLVQGGARHFPQTNQDVAGRFLQVWQGGHTDAQALYLNGFPISDAHAEQSLTDGKIYQTQWFERARFEAHPENQPP